MKKWSFCQQNKKKPDAHSRETVLLSRSNQFEMLLQIQEAQQLSKKKITYLKMSHEEMVILVAFLL